MAAITLALACTVALCLPPERNFRPQRTGLASFMPHLRNKQVMATCLVGFSVLFSTVATFTYANFLLAAPPYNLGPAQLGTIFVTYLLSAAATPLASRLVIRIGRRQTVAIGALCALVGLVFTLMPGLWLIITGLALVAIGIFIEQTLSIGYVAIAARTARATAVGLYVTFYYGRQPRRGAAGRDLGASRLAGLRRADLPRAVRCLGGHPAGLAARLNRKEASGSVCKAGALL
jgi:predicted MFS family arabinose efflux permease